MLRRRRARVGLVMAGIVLIAVGAIAQSQLPAIGAGGLLHPFRRSSVGRPPDSCDAVLFDGANVQLKGWRCRAAGVPPPLGVQRDGFGGTVRRGTLVYLHGIADNRASAVGIIDRFSRRGFDVIERAPLFFTPNAIRRAFQLAEAEGRFTIEAVSPETAARKIQAPVLIIHGSIDRETPPKHSRRVFEALHGPKQLILVPNAGHNQSLTGPVWQDIETWIDRALSAGAVSR